MGTFQPKLNSIEFAKARTRFYGSTDKNAYVGWVNAATDKTIEVITSAASEVEQEASYLFQVFGSKYDALFSAILADIQPYEADINGDDGMLLSFVLATPLRLEMAVRNARRSIHGTPGRLILGSTTEIVGARLQDVSYEGVGFVCNRDFMLNETGILAIATEVGDLSLRFTVRNHKLLSDNGSAGKLYRIGTTVEPLDRISAANWKRFSA